MSCLYTEGTRHRFDSPQVRLSLKAVDGNGVLLYYRRIPTCTLTEREAPLFLKKKELFLKKSKIVMIEYI